MKCLLFLAPGFEECEALITVDLLRRGDIEVVMAAVQDDLLVKSSHGIGIMADVLLKDITPSDFDVLITPGGVKGTQNLEASVVVKEALKAHLLDQKLTCCICASPSILGHMQLLEGRQYTCFPSFDEPGFKGSYQNVLAIQDGNLITGRGMGATIEFARLILKAIAGEEVLVKVEKGIQYEHSFLLR